MAEKAKAEAKAEAELVQLFLCGPLSQWHTSTFCWQGIEYANAETYMMAEKALLFGDAAALASMLAATSPREVKAIGRRIQGFQQNIWDARKFFDCSCRYAAQVFPKPRLGCNAVEHGGASAC